MDLVGSILNLMDKDKKQLSEEEKLKLAKKKEERERHKKEVQTQQNEIRNLNKHFLQEVRNNMREFENDESRQCDIFDYSEIARAEKYDVIDLVETLGFKCIDKGENSTLFIFKKHFLPNDREFLMMIKTDNYNLAAVQQMIKDEDADGEGSANDKKDASKSEIKPEKHYSQKYKNIVNMEAVNTPNKQYGIVPSANKRDHRSIEETLNDMKAKKKKN